MRVTVKEFKAHARRVLQKAVVTWDDNENITSMFVALTHQGTVIGDIGIRLFELVFQKHLRTSIHSFQHNGYLTQSQRRLRAFASHRAIEKRTQQQSMTGKVIAWGRRCLPHRRFNKTRDCFGYGSNGRLATETASGVGMRVPPTSRPHSIRAQAGFAYYSLMFFLGMFAASVAASISTIAFEDQRPEAQETCFEEAAVSFPETKTESLNAAGPNR